MAHAFHPTPAKAGPGQESVWDYPRPPAVQQEARRLEVQVEEQVVASTTRGLRVLETSQAPAYYFPPEDVERAFLRRTRATTLCEWKGTAAYHDVVVGRRVAEQAAWSYPSPNPGYEALRDHVAFYPSRVDACRVGDETAQAMPGGFYGGWVTSQVVGPFKGAPGSEYW